MFLRKKINPSGVVSVQIIDKSKSRYRVLKTIGSSFDAGEVEDLCSYSLATLYFHRAGKKCLPTINLKMSQRIFSLSFSIIFFKFHAVPANKALICTPLEFSIVREGYYSETAYKFRYFQSEGEGILTYRGRDRSGKPLSEHSRR
ncbi:MAG: DUF3872 domain-containing protein [Tannerella sp.]|jgi:hypothetical protein|nr:DUF3872 domain-containing protein [Tannerella sp.]